MDAARARSALAGTRFSDLEWVAETGSTNADLMVAARSGAGERVLVADHQTAGRGRLGRTWEAPAGASILMSVLVRPGMRVVDGHLVTTALGVATVDAIESVTGFRPGLKWPNDLVAVGVGTDGGDRKIAGMLAESVVEGELLTAVVAGIGINVNWPDSMPADLAEIATSLRHVVGHDVDRGDLIVSILVSFEQRLAVLGRPAGSDALRLAYLDRSATLGRLVRVELAAGVIEGVAVDIDVSGRLIVETNDDGVPRRHDVSVGDVIHLRPAD